jgi:L-threonylcarbamoyladenylate synthase
VLHLVVDPHAPDPVRIAEAAVALNAGLLVAFPTETVYGLGAHALDPVAVQRIFAAKGRPAWNPIIVHTATSDQARALAREWPAAAERLTRAFWPGPLTVVVPRGEQVPPDVTAGGDAVALRVPSHPVARALLLAAGIPVAAPSANRSTALSPTTALHVMDSLGDRVAIVLDGGPATVGIESTVVDLRGGEVRILRPGGISAAQVVAVLGAPMAAPDAEPVGDTPRRSPGQLERHYAPRTPLTLVGADDLSALMPGALARIGVLAWQARLSPSENVEWLPADPAGYARGLYAALHRLDAVGLAEILVERVPAGPEWEAVRDRLRRAASR